MERMTIEELFDISWRNSETVETLIELNSTNEFKFQIGDVFELKDSWGEVCGTARDLTVILKKENGADIILADFIIETNE